MDIENTVKSNIQQRYLASNERNLLGEGIPYSARRRVLNGIVHCKHGLDPDCSCVQKLAVDKSSSLTEQQAKVGAALFIRSEIEKLKLRDTRYVPLTTIIKCSEDERDSYIDKYESAYSSLLSEGILDVDDSVAHLKRYTPPPIQNHRQQPTLQGSSISLLIVVIFSFFLAVLYLVMYDKYK